MSARQSAARFGVGISTATRWIARASDGEATSRPQGWRRPSVLDAHETFVVAMIDDRKDVTLDEWSSVCLLSGRLVSAEARLVPGCGAAAGRLKKVRTCIGARPAGRPETTASLV
ncbi:hypothetical protein [Agrobacterium tumefaciens]